MVGPSVFPEKRVISNWLVLQYFQTHELYQNGWSFSISRYTGYTKMVGFSVFPDSQVLKMTDNPISHYFQIFHTFFYIIFTFLSHFGPEIQFQPPQYNRSCNLRAWLRELNSMREFKIQING